MDALLADAMTADEPRLPADFDSRVMRAVRPRRLGLTGRIVMLGYGLVAAATTVWCMQSLPAVSVLLSIAITVALAAGLGAYGRRLVAGG
jgi:hypothetical protein